jgi:hypothetical protein
LAARKNCGKFIGRRISRVVLLSNIPKRFIVKGEDGFEDLFTAGPTAATG